ncbi:ester cyclase [Streptomyces sp. NBC_00258]|uniref:ester cyclase n=1 Tax=Streptomyces sp. NBC_00258 TaxID=2903642 RepID=UPI002E2AAAA4|nr:ester cyclase [Streptomyces sp. NBC_00258]
MSAEPTALSKLNAEVVLRYLRVFETRDLDELAELAAEDRVATAFTLTYTHDLTGRDLTMTGIKSYRLSEGRIVEFWGETDLYGLLRQLGLVPEEIPPF